MNIGDVVTYKAAGMPVIGEVIWVKPRLSLAVLRLASAASSSALADW